MVLFCKILYCICCFAKKDRVSAEDKTICRSRYLKHEPAHVNNTFEVAVRQTLETIG